MDAVRPGSRIGRADVFAATAAALPLSSLVAAAE